MIARPAALAVALGLAGCALAPPGPDALPTIRYVAPAPLAVVRDCLVRGGSASKDYFGGGVPAAQVADLTGMTKIVFLDDPRFEADLSPAPGGGTEVRYFGPVNSLRPQSTLADAVRACAIPKGAAAPAER